MLRNVGVLTCPVTLRPFSEETQLFSVLSLGQDLAVGSGMLVALSLTAGYCIWSKCGHQKTLTVRQVTLPEKQEEGQQAGRTFRNWLALGDLLSTACVPSIGTHTCKPMPWGLETYRIRWEEGEKS